MAVHQILLTAALALGEHARVTPALHDTALYEAYSELHALSQQTNVLSLQQLRAPTVVICGRQTDGKSALLEALMGFQFNHVGGGTKTRRPIALQMQYHPDKEEPACCMR